MTKGYKIMLVAGARPNFMKIAPIYKELKKHKRFRTLIVHTGQHYDRDMSDVFFRDLKLPKPDVYLGVGSASHAVQTARIMEKFEPVCLREKPDLVMVVGDVNSTIACALTAVKLGIKVAHVEAGLRSFDRSMPEEINRLLTDQISDYLFTTCRDGDQNLRREGIPARKIFFVGNTMIDTLRQMIWHNEMKLGSREVGKPGNKDKKIRKPYALVTLHRPSNVDDILIFRGIWRALETIAKKIPVIFPVHPRTRKMLSSSDLIGGSKKQDSRCHLPLWIPAGVYPVHGYGTGMTKNAETTKEGANDIRKCGNDNSGIVLTRPLGYLEFMSLMANAALVLTDSGGIQEETTILGIPCLTLRHNTERPITITQGTNKLVGTDPGKIIREAVRIINGVKGMRGYGDRNKYHRNRWSEHKRRPMYWDGKAASRIAHILKNVK